MRTKASSCARKRRFPAEADAIVAASAADVALRPYRCDRCRMFHLTSRTKGKRPWSAPADRDPPKSIRHPAKAGIARDEDIAPA